MELTTPSETKMTDNNRSIDPIELSEIGRVVSVGDGIARVYGFFVKGITLNPENENEALSLHRLPGRGAFPAGEGGIGDREGSGSESDESSDSESESDSTDESALEEDLEEIEWVTSDFSSSSSEEDDSDPEEPPKPEGGEAAKGGAENLGNDEDPADPDEPPKPEGLGEAAKGGAENLGNDEDPADPDEPPAKRTRRECIFFVLNRKIFILT